MFRTFVVEVLTLNLKQKMDDILPVATFVIGIAFTSLLWILFLTPANTAYAKGITDCRSCKVSYTVTVGPDGVDTTYTYKP